MTITVRPDLESVFLERAEEWGLDPEDDERPSAYSSWADLVSLIDHMVYNYMDEPLWVLPEDTEVVHYGLADSDGCWDSVLFCLRPRKRLYEAQIASPLSIDLKYLDPERHDCEPTNLGVVRWLAEEIADHLNRILPAYLRFTEDVPTP